MMMGDVVELRPRRREEYTASLGMIVFLASWAMMFAAFFFAYLFARSKAVVWPPVGLPRLPVAMPAVNTLVMLASSGTFVLAIQRIKRGNRKAFQQYTALTFGLGALFLALQAMVWRDVGAQGLSVSDGVYGAVFYAFTALHALHVVAGLMVLAWVLVRSFTGTYSEHNHTNVRVSAMFWHFVDVVWLLMFVTIYVI